MQRRSKEHKGKLYLETNSERGSCKEVKQLFNLKGKVKGRLVERKAEANG